MDFTIVGDITDIETFAVGKAIREIGRLRKRYGRRAVAEAQGDCPCETVRWYYSLGGVALVQGQ